MNLGKIQNPVLKMDCGYKKQKQNADKNIVRSNLTSFHKIIETSKNEVAGT